MGGWFAFIAELFGAGTRASSDSTETVAVTSLCIGPEDTVLEHAKQAGVTLRDHPDSLPSRAPDPARDTPLPSLMISGKAAIWVDEQGEVFVDAALIGPVAAVRPALLGPGERVAVGQLKDPSGIERRGLIQQLMTANLIVTFVHIGSELCVTPTPTGAKVTGTHTYYTNEKNVEELAFAVDIDPAGLITVTGA